VFISLTQAGVHHPSAKAGDALALRHIGLSLNAGEQVAVIGPSGAGKTTLLHTLALALKPAAGHISWTGGTSQAPAAPTDPWTLPHGRLQQWRGQLFLAPQVPPLPPRQRVVTAVLAGRLPRWSLWASLKSLFLPQDMGAAQSALARFDLADKLFDRVDRLSGGERQRVGLARALIALQSAPDATDGARLLLVDEPLSALDPTRATQALQAITTDARERGVTLVASLHQVELALAHFPRIVGLRQGELVFDLPASQVTPELLQNLYAQHLDELTGPAPVALSDHHTVPVVMHCR
jgi:phosphonate transport system ATP-binding protein